MGMDFEDVLLVPSDIGGTSRLSADIVLGEDAPSRQDERIEAIGALGGWDELGHHEAALATHEAADMHDGRAFRRLFVARPLHRPQAIELLEADTGEGRRNPGDFIHDLGSRRVVHPITEPGRNPADDLPFIHPLFRLGYLANPIDAAFGVGEGAVLFEEGRSRKEHMREGGSLVEEKILDDNAFHLLERRGHVVGIGIGLRNVFALYDKPEECAVERGAEHVGDTQAGFGIERDRPHILEEMTYGVVGDMTIAGEFMRKRAHVARALNIVLAAQRVDANPIAAVVAGGHGEICHRHHHGRALAVFGDAEAVIDGAIAAGSVEARGGVGTKSMRRGSATMSLAPSRKRRFMREANTGCASVGLAPITRMTSDWSTLLKSWVPAEVPSVVLRP